MSGSELLQIVSDEDINWDSLKGIPQKALDRAKVHSFHFPGHKEWRGRSGMAA